MSDTGLSIERQDEVLRVTLDRPGRLNALTRPMIRALGELFRGLYLDREIRVVVLRGAGESFCAGLDLKEFAEQDPQPVGEELFLQREIAEIVMAMRRCPQPIIALVDGAAAGGGFALALASDVRIGTPRLKMNAAFIRIGLSACDIGVSYFLPRMVGSSVAAEYMLTGRFLRAEDALRHGLVSRIVAPEALAAEGDELLKDMLRATPLGLRLTKEALNVAIDAQGLEAVVAMEDRNQILAAQDSTNCREGVAAFLEKREPRYRR